MMGRWIKRLIVATVALLGVAGAALYVHFQQPREFAPASVSYELKPGTKLRGAARELHAMGVLRMPLLFEMLARVRGDTSHIKAGNYEITSPISPLALLRKLTRGDTSLAMIRFIEGWTFQQVRQALDAHEAIRHDTRGFDDARIARELGVQEGSMEGWIFPDSYYFARGSSDLAVLRRAHTLMRKRLAALWSDKESGVPLNSPYEALILASIIEKETGRGSERALISAVFNNRLKRGMRLQTDPTVIYGMGAAFDGNLRRHDLQTDTPWNTYTREGLPPTPIAMPGLDSLKAALEPAQSDMLYFVSRGDGSSKFSRTLDEHNAAVNKYQRAPSRAARK